MFDHSTLQKILGQAEKIESTPAAINQTIRMMAKELAGTFYEGNRSPGFRRAFPTFKAYMRGQWHEADGSIKLYKPGWLFHVELARKVLASMLGDNRVHSNLKDPIYEALIEHSARASRPGAKKLHQAGFEGELQ
jgi:hypothetical protein